MTANEEGSIKHMHQPDDTPRIEGNGLSPTSSEISLLKRLSDFRLWLICAGFLAVGVLGLNEKMMFSPDSSRYILWAESLAAFNGFTNTSGPEPVRYVVHAPFYPIMLAPFAWFFDEIIIPAKVLTIGFGMALLILFFLWTARRAGGGFALVGTLFLALNSLIILFSGHVLSDIPFIAFVVAFFMLAQKMTERPDEERWAWWLVAVLTVGIFLREIGLTLLMGAVAYLLLTKQYRRLLLVFTIPMFFYLLWYFRNEAYYGELENPSIRNMRLMLGHYFSADGDSLVSEFFARMLANAEVYLKWAKGLILFPQFLSQSYAAAELPNSIMEILNKTLRIAQYPLVILQYGLFGWGVRVGWRENKTTLLILLFAFFYMTVVLLYPINDLRFLVPMMVLMLHFCVIGGRDIAHRLSNQFEQKRLMMVLAGIVLLLVALPNVLWAYGYVEGNKGNLRERKDPTRQVAQWIAQHSEPSTTVLSRWGEVALWLEGRKLVLTDHLLSLTLFDSYIRDYNIGYIVTFISEPGIREYEFQMLQTKRYAFTPVYRADRLEVVQVRKLSGTKGPKVWDSTVVSGDPHNLLTAREMDARKFFAKGVQELEAGRPSEALHIFSPLLESSGSGYIGLFCGITLEIGGQYEAALRVYDKLRQQLQAGPFIIHAQAHASLVRNLERAEKESSKTERAGIYQRVSSVFWDLGFRQFTLQLLGRSLHEDSTFAPSLIFGMYYSIQRGDTVVAKRFFTRLKSTNRNHAIISTVAKLFDAMDSARTARSIPQRLVHQVRLAKSYAELGLVDATIDEAFAILEKDSSNVGALQLLAEAYDLKGRIAPAVRVLERLLTIKPDDSVAREKLERLKKRM
jgi:tetratricopeptide (TPR) repeat protein